MDSKECTKYFYEDVRCFLKPVADININCKSDVVNHITFAFIVLTIVGGISAWLLENKNVFFVFILLSVLHMVFWYFRYTPLVLTEPFESKIQGSRDLPDGYKEDIIGEEVTYPTAHNPFMNVLVDEIKYNPTRAPAASVMDPSVNVQLDDFFHTQFVNDPTDVFNRSQSQREFYTMPVTSVPNDQDSYQNWLYRIPGKTCKEGNCTVTGTDGSPIPWLNSSN